MLLTKARYPILFSAAGVYQKAEPESSNWTDKKTLL